jgi:hypothetical protein
MKIAGVILLFVGIVFLGIQNTFYGYVSDDGVLHDSLFLPLGAFALIISLVLFLLLGILFLIKKIKSK